MKRCLDALFAIPCDIREVFSHNKSSGDPIHGWKAHLNISSVRFSPHTSDDVSDSANSQCNGQWRSSDKEPNTDRFLLTWSVVSSFGFCSVFFNIRRNYLIKKVILCFISYKPFEYPIWKKYNPNSDSNENVPFHAFPSAVSNRGACLIIFVMLGDRSHHSGCVTLEFVSLSPIVAICIALLILSGLYLYWLVDSYSRQRVLS
jgi:hypothetical protein